eukprot:SM000011S19148  [mRNA]  locus=s11:1137987:1139317:- [translate_table: standard]
MTARSPRARRRQHAEALRELLEGLCGGEPEAIRVHELVLKTLPTVGLALSEVRLLCSLDGPSPAWTLRHVGGAMRGAGADQLLAVVRSVEFLRTGLAFFYRSGRLPLRIAVTTVHRLPKLHSIDNAVPVAPEYQVVDITATATSENYSEGVAALTNFAEHLAPLLRLSKPGVATGLVPTAATAAAAIASGVGSN